MKCKEHLFIKCVNKDKGFCFVYDMTMQTPLSNVRPGKGALFSSGVDSDYHSDFFLGEGLLCDV